MKSLAWKLAVVAAVMGVGVLVMLQAQHAMSRAASETPAQTADAHEDPGNPAKPPEPSNKPDLFTDEPNRRESHAGQHGNHTADATAENPDLKPPKTAQTPKPAETAASPLATPKPATSDDPFADNSDSKRLPASEPPKTASAMPAMELKQTSGTAEDHPAKADSASEPPSKAPAATGPVLPGASSGPPELNDPKSSTKTPDSPAGEQREPAPDPKGAGGPQLLPPGPAKDPAPPASSDTPQGSSPAGPSTPGPSLPGGTPPDRSTEIDKARGQSGAPRGAEGPAVPSPAVPAEGPGGLEPGKTKREPDLFPALEDPPPATPPAARNKKSNNKKTSKSSAEGPADSAERPTPLPADPAHEAPMPATSKNSPPAPPALPAGQPERRGDAPPQVRAEPGPDFQGDGTIGERAPLGMQRPQLNIEKVAPPNALLGQPMVYSIVVKNVGSSEAHDVVVEDRIPKGTKLSGTIPQAELSGKKLSWRIGNLAPGEQRKISIRVVPLEAGEIGSVATVNFVAEAAAGTVVTAPRLQLEILAKQSARLGEVVPFRFRVKNIGTGEARSVVVRDLIPTGLSHSAGNDLEYEIGRLPPGQSKELTLELKAVKVGSAVNRAVALAEGGLSVEAKAGLEVTGSKIALSRSGPTRRYLGRPGVYTNTLVNESPFAVEGVIVVESVPPGLEFAGASHGGQYNDGSRTIAWRIDRMAQGETLVVKSKLIPKAAGNHTSLVRVSVPNGEPTEASGVTAVDGFAAIGIDVASIDGPVDVGEKVTFRINVRNKGTIPATNVAVTVEIPEQLAVKSARGPGKHAQEGNVVRFGPVPAMEGRTEATCELVLEARKKGDSRIKITAQADQIERPLSREESILILAEQNAPSGS